MSIFDRNANVFYLKHTVGITIDIRVSYIYGITYSLVLYKQVAEEMLVKCA